jgi:hypothetical protein
MVKWFKRLAAFPNNRLVQSLPKSFSLSSSSTSTTNINSITTTEDRPISSLFDSSHDTKSTEIPDVKKDDEEYASPSHSGSKLSLDAEEDALQAVSHSLLLLNTILNVPSSESLPSVFLYDFVVVLSNSSYSRGKRKKRKSPNPQRRSLCLPLC